MTQMWSIRHFSQCRHLAGKRFEVPFRPRRKAPRAYRLPSAVRRHKVDANAVDGRAIELPCVRKNLIGRKEPELPAKSNALLTRRICKGGNGCEHRCRC